MFIDDMTDELDLGSTKDTFFEIYRDLLISKALKDGSHISKEVILVTPKD
jgi:hypothetical protein